MAMNLHQGLVYQWLSSVGAAGRRGLASSARHLSPWGAGPFLRHHWRVISMWLLLLLGLVVQVIVIALVYELVDLTVSLMELWAEIAAKHLRITLDR